MSSNRNQFLAGAMGTDYPQWKNIVFTVLMTAMCLGMPCLFWYLYVSTENLECYKGFLYLSITWVVVELVLIAYMFQYNNVPRFARNAMGLMLAFSNLWFGLFVLGLEACGA